MIQFVEDKSLLPKERYVTRILKSRGMDCSTWISQGTRERGHTIVIHISTKKGSMNLRFPWPFKKNGNKYIIDLEDMILKEYNTDTPIQLITKELLEEYDFIQSLPKTKPLKPDIHKMVLKYKNIQYKNLWGYSIDFYR